MDGSQLAIGMGQPAHGRRRGSLADQAASLSDSFRSGIGDALTDSFRQVCTDVANLKKALPAASPVARKVARIAAANRAVVVPASAADEMANTLSHGLGLFLSIAAAAGLLIAAAGGGTTHLLACGIYSASLIALYATSSVYHALPRGEQKSLLQALDHSAIYLFIAGTYTPYMLILLDPVWSLPVLGAVWMIAIGGSVQKIKNAGRLHSASALPYIVMGWLVLVAAKPVIESFPTGAIAWLFAGGLCYTMGVYFFVNDHKRFYHAIWHVFVMAGSACHFVGIIACVIRAGQGG